MDSISTSSGSRADIFSFETPLWDRFYRKCKNELKDSRYYRTVRKRSKLI